ncbi:hypothetical protein GCM10022419_062110 [Nonomuraea rosea]|uniref:Uncharacterized protein n=1 Tax=Nonomuraea rosea TaxID=638574 RepID=A0ABP6XUG0_9ACTN
MIPCDGLAVPTYLLPPPHVRIHLGTGPPDACYRSARIDLKLNLLATKGSQTGAAPDDLVHQVCAFQVRALA